MLRSIGLPELLVILAVVVLLTLPALILLLVMRKARVRAAGQPASRYCTNCGNPANWESKFCGACGRRMTS